MNASYLMSFTLPSDTSTFISEQHGSEYYHLIHIGMCETASVGRGGVAMMAWGHILGRVFLMYGVPA